MTDKQKKTEIGNRVGEDKRFSYIGFDVFPGKPKDLFKSDAEKKQFEEAAAKKKAKGELLREDCTLTQERVSLGERLILTIACVVIIGALFLPWYSAYTEVEDIVEEMASTEAVVDTTAMDSLGTLTDSLGVVMATETDNPGDAVAEATEAVEEAPVEDMAVTGQEETPDEEIIHGLVAKKKIHREYSTLSGFGGMVSLGSVGSYVFGSGFILMLSGILMILYTLACIGLPLVTLYSIYGIKGKKDDVALQLKKYLKLNWWPVILFFTAVLISFAGASYGFDVSESFTSLGSAYGIGALLNTLTYGILVSLFGFVLLGAKGMEI